MASKSLQKCVICDRRRSSVPNMFLAALPLDPTRCQRWVQAIGQQDLVYLPIEKLHQLKFVCGIHFAKEDFNRQGNRLLKTAVPKLNLPHAPLPEELFVDFPMRIGCERVQFSRAILSDCTQGVLNQSIQQRTETKVEDLSKNKPQPTISMEPMELENVPIASTSGTETASISTAVDYETRNKIGPSEALESAPQPSTSASVQVFVRSHTRMGKSTHGKNQLSKKEEKLLQRLKTAKSTLKTLAKSMVNLDNLESDFLKNILTDAVKNQKRKPHGKRWDMKNKILSLAIFKRSPRTYRFLQKQMPLPSEKTLHRIIKSIPMDTGINETIIQNIKKKIAESPPRDKMFALLFDEMALKKRLIYNESTDKVEGYVDLGEDMGRYPKIADHVLVFMLQGLCRKVKQPLAYYFVEGTISTEKLSVIIKNIIIALKNAGIAVLCTVCDQGPTNVGAVNLMKKFSHLTPETNYFHVEDEKIYIIYDIPHLFKSIRNNFYQAGEIKYGEKTGKWRHLIEAEERNRNFLNFRKLTETVVNPTYKIKMRVKYAAHALSNTMAAVIKMMAWTETDKNKQKEINETAEIIEKLDRLFDCTNGPSSHDDVKKGIRENVSDESNHTELWNEYLKIMDSIKFIKSDSQLQLSHVRCINGFKISIKSLKDIWWQLKTIGNFKYLNLRQLNQDALENLFGLIRQHGVTNKNPTCAHFTAALKTVLVSGFTTALSRGSNCAQDQNRLYLNFQQLLSSSKKELNSEVSIEELDEINCPTISLPDILNEYEHDLLSFEEQPIVYVSGYVAAKLLHKHSCQTCSACLKNDKPLSEDGLYKYISLREWWQDKQSLTYPTKKLCDTIATAKTVFENNIAKDLHKKNISCITNLELMVHCNMDWVVCSDHREKITKNLFFIISKMYIRQQCQIINNRAKKVENDFADISKRAQQQSKEK